MVNLIVTRSGGQYLHSVAGTQKPRKAGSCAQALKETRAQARQEGAVPVKTERRSFEGFTPSTRTTPHPRTRHSSQACPHTPATQCGSPANSEAPAHDLLRLLGTNIKREPGSPTPYLPSRRSSQFRKLGVEEEKALSESVNNALTGPAREARSRQSR